MKEEQVFLIDLSLDEDLEKLYAELDKDGRERILSFGLDDNKDVPRKYLIGGLHGELKWGEDNELRPMGVHTKDFHIIGGRVISLDEYLRAVRMLLSLEFGEETEYVVKETPELVQILKDDGYRFWHRPYFAMMGSTHSLITVHPRSKSAVDAAKVGTESITTEEFIRIYGESLLNEKSLDFEKFIERVKDAPVCDDLIMDAETGLVTGVESQHRGILRIPEGPVEIASWGLKQKYVTDLILPDTLVELDERALSGCESLRRLYLPASVRRINKLVFSSRIIDLYYNGSKELWDSLQNKNPHTRKGTRDGIAQYGNDWAIEHMNIHFECVV